MGSEGRKIQKKIIWVDDAKAFGALMDDLQKESEIAVDLEGDSLHHFQDRVCLIQVSTSRFDWVVDPQSGRSLDGLWRLFEDSQVVKIFHDADFDLRSLNRDYDLTVRNIFDTKVAAELLGWDQLGLAANLNKHFGVTLTKKFQRYNWSRRPISADALNYAAMDTRYLTSLKTICLQELENQSKLGWARQEFRYLETFRWKPSKKERLQFWSLSGVRRMPSVKQEAVRQLWNIRRAEAERVDQPVFRVFSDQSLIHLVNAMYNGENLGQSLDKTIPRRLQKKVRAAVEAIKRLPENHSLNIPDELMERKPEYDKSLFEKLKSCRDISAGKYSIDPGIIAGARILKQIAGMDTSSLDSYPDVHKKTGIRPWQFTLLGLGATR